MQRFFRNGHLLLRARHVVFSLRHGDGRLGSLLLLFVGGGDKENRLCQTCDALGNERRNPTQSGTHLLYFMTIHHISFSVRAPSRTTRRDEASATPEPHTSCAAMLSLSLLAVSNSCVSCCRADDKRDTCPRRTAHRVSKCGSKDTDFYNSLWREFENDREYEPRPKPPLRNLRAVKRR